MKKFNFTFIQGRGYWKIQTFDNQVFFKGLVFTILNTRAFQYQQLIPVFKTKNSHTDSKVICTQNPVLNTDYKYFYLTNTNLCLKNMYIISFFTFKH